MITATVTEMQNDIEKYLDFMMLGEEIIITKDGHEVGRFIPRNTPHSLKDILKREYELDKLKEERWGEKNEVTD